MKHPLRADPRSRMSDMDERRTPYCVSRLVTHHPSIAERLDVVAYNSSWLLLREAGGTQMYVQWSHVQMIMLEEL